MGGVGYEAAVVAASGVGLGVVLGHCFCVIVFHLLEMGLGDSGDVAMLID